MTVTADRQRVAERSKLRRLADLHERTSADVWQIESDGLGTRMFVRRFDGRGHVVCEFTEFAGSDDVTLVAEALDMLAFFLPLIGRAKVSFRDQAATIDRLAAEIDALMTARDKPGNFTAQASMLLCDGRFQRFLSERRHGEVIDSKEAADAALKEAIEIKSKKEINADDGALQRWFDLRAEFSAWEMGVTQ